MSWLLIPALIGPILGPPVGGMIVTYLDWRWIFYINLPVGFLGVGAGDQVHRPGARRGAPPKPDFLGFVLSGLSLGCLLFGFEMTSRSGELAALTLIGVGFGAGGLYILQAGTPHPRRRSSTCR